MHWVGRTQAVSRSGDRQLPAQPHWLHGGEEDNPQPGLHPKPALSSGALGERRWQRACPGRDRFWCSPGVVLTAWLFLGLYLTERMSVEAFLPGLHFQSSLCPWFALLCPDPHHQAVSEQQWVPLCLCASTSPACSCTSHVLLSQSFEAEIFSWGDAMNALSSSQSLVWLCRSEYINDSTRGQQGFQEETSSLKKTKVVLFSGRGE